MFFKCWQSGDEKNFYPSLDNEDKFELPVISTYIRYKNINILFDTGCHPSVEKIQKKDGVVCQK